MDLSGLRRALLGRRLDRNTCTCVPVCVHMCACVPVCACAYVCVCSVAVSLCACVPVCVHMNTVVVVTAESCLPLPWRMPPLKRQYGVSLISQGAGGHCGPL